MGKSNIRKAFSRKQQQHEDSDATKRHPSSESSPSSVNSNSPAFSSDSFLIPPGLFSSRPGSNDARSRSVSAALSGSLQNPNILTLNEFFAPQPASIQERPSSNISSTSATSSTASDAFFGKDAIYSKRFESSNYRVPSSSNEIFEFATGSLEQKEGEINNKAISLVESQDSIELWVNGKQTKSYQSNTGSFVIYDPNSGPLLFEKLSISFHQKFVKYFGSVFDLKNIAQAFPHLKCIYGAESWKSCIVINGLVPYKVDQGNKRVIPFRVFCSPHKYRWFQNISVSEIFFKMPLCLLEPLVPHALSSISHAYPSLQISHFSYTDDDNWQIDDLKVLLEALDDFTSIDIAMNISFKTQHLKNNNLLLNLPTKEKLRSLSLGLDRKSFLYKFAPACSTHFKLSDFYNLEELFFRPNTQISYNQHREFMMDIGKMKKLNVFSTCLVVNFEKKRLRPINEIISPRGQESERVKYTKESQTSALLKMVDNFNLIKQKLFVFMVYLESVGNIDAHDFSNSVIDLFNVTHFSSAINDSPSSPIIDRLRFSKKILSLDLNGCSVGYPRLPDSITKLSLKISPSTALNGYSQLLKTHLPHIKSVRLVTTSYYRNFDIRSTEENVSFVRSLGVVLQKMSQSHDLLKLVNDWLEKKVFTPEFMLLKMFDILQKNIYSHYFQAICDILVQPSKNLVDSFKDSFGNKILEKELSSIQFFSFIEIFVLALTRFKELEYLEIDGFAFFNTSPRFHSYFLRNEYPEMIPKNLKQIKFTGTDVYATEFTDKEFKMVGGYLSELPILFHGFPKKYFALGEAIKGNPCLFIFDMEVKNNNLIPCSLLREKYPLMFFSEASHDKLSERKDIRIVSKRITRLPESFFECRKTSLSEQGWV
ncbi:uncharacterized protein SAPINGB_P002122 [Magnusiomyces paraingens]|uniref:Uncharacterized protein n=1 Tax=Magnusiomyces paraingens TaxID=2606893 RepID=A0A5E8BEJ3_9ASCO|nr:uncharacterized protein SAPINGB_P002122 [Saprochaete ingens]VVT49137.1 unnamed protein product [Saprochaete ingens]